MEEQKDIKKMKSEEIGLLLSSQYDILFQAQANIRSLKQELEDRNAKVK